MEHAYPFEIRPLRDAIGAEISGVDVSKALDEATIDAVRDAFHSHSVLLFRGQSLTPESLIAFSEYFGVIDLHINPQYHLDGYSEITVVGNVVVDGVMTSLFVNIDEEWHTDRSYMAHPSLGRYSTRSKRRPKAPRQLRANSTNSNPSSPSPLPLQR